MVPLWSSQEACALTAKSSDHLVLFLGIAGSWVWVPSVSWPLASGLVPLLPLDTCNFGARLKLQSGGTLNLTLALGTVVPTGVCAIFGSNFKNRCSVLSLII